MSKHTNILETQCDTAFQQSIILINNKTDKIIYNNDKIVYKSNYTPKYIW